MGKFLELNVESSVLGQRRWFYSPHIDLIVWTNDVNVLVRFEFYYDKTVNEHVLIWHQDSGFTHMAVEDGEQKPALHYKQAPILIADGHFDLDRIRSLFQHSSEDLPPQVAHAIGQALGI